jgi:hypothetical protein
MEKLTTIKQLESLEVGDLINKCPEDKNLNTINYTLHSKSENELQELELMPVPSTLVSDSQTIVTLGPIKKSYQDMIQEGIWWKLP